jgi:hypothetical protein
MRNLAEAGGRRKEISSNGSKGQEAEVITERSSACVFTLMNGTGGMNSTVYTGGLSTRSIGKELDL